MMNNIYKPAALSACATSCPSGTTARANGAAASHASAQTNTARDGARDGAANGAGNGATNGAATAQGGAGGAPFPPGFQGGNGASTAPAPRQPACHGAPNGACHGAGNGARNGAAEKDAGEIYDAELVIYRLEEAGSTLLALPMGGYSTRLRQSKLEIVQAALEAYGAETRAIRPPVPSAARITRMDQALGWVPLIPRDRHVLRRIVGARSLVSPTTERHLFSWRRLGALLGADHKAIQRWHAQGVDMIVAALNRTA